MSEARRKTKPPITLSTVASRAEAVSADVTRLAKAAGVTILAVVAIGASIFYAVQDQIDSLKEKGRQFQQDIQENTQRSQSNQQQIETAQQRVARLKAELAAANAQNDQQANQLANQVDAAQDDADAAKAEARKKKPPVVIEKQVPGPPASPTPTPRPSPTPKTGPLGLPPLFPSTEE